MSLIAIWKHRLESRLRAPKRQRLTLLNAQGSELEALIGRKMSLARRHDEIDDAFRFRALCQLYEDVATSAMRFIESIEELRISEHARFVGFDEMPASNESIFEYINRLKRFITDQCVRHHEQIMRPESIIK